MIRMILNRRAIASKGGAKTSYQPFFDPTLKGDEKHPKGLSYSNIFFKICKVLIEKIPDNLKMKLPSATTEGSCDR